MSSTKKHKKSTKKQTYVAIVLDRSGSMGSIRTETIESINKQLRVLRESAKSAGKMNVSLIQFDDVIDVVFDAIDNSALPILEDKDFVPRGMTALYDGMWTAITHLKSKPKTDDTAYLICVISDGGENASKEVTQSTLTSEIKYLQDLGNWTFTYLMANVDVNQIARTLNAYASNISAWTSNAAGASLSGGVMSESLNSYVNLRGSKRANVMNAVYAAFSDEDKNKLAK